MKNIKYKPISSKITPENTIITFDLHDVIFEYDYLEIIKTFLHSEKKTKLIITILNPFI